MLIKKEKEIKCCPQNDTNSFFSSSYTGADGLSYFLVHWARSLLYLDQSLIPVPRSTRGHCMCTCMPSTGTRVGWMHHLGCWLMHHLGWWMGTTHQMEVCWEFEFCFLSPFCCAVVVRFGFGCSLTGLMDAISIYLIEINVLSINYKG